jgi:hypothetical protein
MHEMGRLRLCEDLLRAEMLNTIYLNYLMMIDPMFVFTNKQRTDQYAEKCSDEFCAEGLH